MTQEEKQILLIDLCPRLLYGVKGRYCLYDSKGNLTDFGNEPEIVENIDLQKEKIWTDGTVQGYYFDEFKIYLRPMSSMTEEEKKEFDEVIKSCNNKVFACPEKERRYKFFDAEQEDFMNAHHFDYRGLIPMGLALEALEGMYKEENK